MLDLKNFFQRSLIQRTCQYILPRSQTQVFTDLNEYIAQLSNKGINICNFREWRNGIFLVIDDKINNFKTKIIPRKVNSAFNDCDVIANLEELHSNFVFLPIGKAANNAAIICKRLYALVIAKELGFKSGNSNYSGTYDKINSIMESDIISEHKEYLSNHYGIKRNSKIETLPLMYWIPKMHENPVRPRFIIALPKCTLKPLLKNITAVFKVL